MNLIRNLIGKDNQINAMQISKATSHILENKLTSFTNDRILHQSENQDINNHPQNKYF